MSARLAIADLGPVADLLERLQELQAAMVDLSHRQGDVSAFKVQIHNADALSVSESLIASAYRLPYFAVLQGLAAMERELLQQLASKDIQIESALPMREDA
jgi:hypothetical protein